MHAKITPFSSVVGQSVMLTDETGAVVAQLSISIPDPSKPYRETAAEIARIIELAINVHPTEEVKRLRVRLGDLMIKDAKRMAALAKPASEPAGGGVWEANWQEMYAREAHKAMVLQEEVSRLSSPASSSPAEAEALPDGVEAGEVKRIQDWLLKRHAEHLSASADNSLMMRREFGDAEMFLDAAILLSTLANLSPAPAQAGSFVASGKEER
jgi:hypothetical protein